MGKRTCRIMTASIEDDEGSDGEYDLHGMHGTPEEIGRAIARSLAEVDLSEGTTSLSRAGKPLRLRLLIEFRGPPEEKSGSLTSRYRG